MSSTCFYAKDFVDTFRSAEKNSRNRRTPPSTISTILDLHEPTIQLRPSPPQFLQHIRPLLMFTRAIGLFPMKLPASNGDVAELAQVSYAAIAYSLCLYAFILYSIVIIYVYSIRRVIAPNQAFNVIVYIVGNLALIHTFTVVPFSHWRNAKKYAVLVIRWMKFLRHYEHVFGYYPNLKTKETLRFSFVVTTALFFIMTVSVVFGVRGRPYIHYEVSGIFIVLASTALQYHIFCKNVQIVSEYLGTVFRRDSVCSVLMLCNVTEMWMRLTAMTRAMNSIFNANVTISLFLTATSGSLAAFGLTIKLLKRYELNESWYMSFIFQLCDIINIYFLCNSAENATKHLGENIRKKLLNCDLNHASFHELQQVDKFLQTMKIDEPNLHVIGFVKINRKLFCKIYSILATYMIVLIQFQLTMPYQTV